MELGNSSQKNEIKLQWQERRKSAKLLVAEDDVLRGCPLLKLLFSRRCRSHATSGRSEALLFWKKEEIDVAVFRRYQIKNRAMCSWIHAKRSENRYVATTPRRKGLC